MMMRVIGAIMLVGLMVVAIKVAIFVGIIVALLRWPKETVAVLAAMAILHLIAHYPVAAGIPFGIIALFGFCKLMAKPPG